jgi:hypothetical protein
MNERAKRENDDDNNKTRRKDHRTENRENATALLRPSSLDEFGKLFQQQRREVSPKDSTKQNS